ncbi:hypothetical protein ABPG75_001797 [Micractinium tetrahymenae]
MFALDLLICAVYCLQPTSKGILPLLPVLAGAVTASLVFFAAGWRGSIVCPAAPQVNAPAATDGNGSIGSSSGGSIGSSSGSGGSTAELRVQPAMRNLGITPEHLWREMLRQHPAAAAATVVEVGSWDGSQCREALAAGVGTVVCFEPGPINYNRTVETLRQQLGDKRLRLEQKVVSNTTGDKVVFRNTGSTGDHAGPAILGETAAFQEKQFEVYVDSVALDDYFPDASSSNPIYVMKIDTQGFEGMVLQGMKRLLQAHAVQTILMELWPTAMDRVAPCEEALTLLLQAGYQVFETGLKHIGEEQPPSLEEWSRHPTDPAALCQWYRQHSGKFGLWTDIVAVAPQASR